MNWIPLIGNYYLKQEEKKNFYENIRAGAHVIRVTIIPLLLLHLCIQYNILYMYTWWANDKHPVNILLHTLRVF